VKGDQVIVEKQDILPFLTTIPPQAVLGVQGPGVMNGPRNEAGRSGLPQSVPLCHDSIFIRKSTRNSIFFTFQNQLSSFAFTYSPIDM